MSKVVVALDTSLGFSVAIADEKGKLLLKDNLSAVGRESDRLMTPWLVACLEKAGSSLAEVQKWTLGIGPGSFAGLRCGIATAKGAALANGAFLRGVPSAYALATIAPKSAKTVGVLHDGRCGEFLFERFVRENGSWKLAGESEPILPAALLETSRACDCYVTLQPEILEICPNEISEKTTVLEHLDASALLEAPEALYPWPTDWAGCESSTDPLYVRQAVFVKPATLRHE